MDAEALDRIERTLDATVREMDGWGDDAELTKEERHCRDKARADLAAFRELRRDADRLRAAACIAYDADGNETAMESPEAVVAYRKACAAEIARLRADAARLDWLGTADHAWRDSKGGFYIRRYDEAIGVHGPTLRAAIDAATAGEGKR